MNATTKILNDRDNILFEKSLKFYFFARQQQTKALSTELQERFRYSGQVAYSFIITYIKEDTLKIEYMDFMNEEIKTLRGLDADLLEPLMIKPHEIDEIEFNDSVDLKVYDEDDDRKIRISYNPSGGMVSYEKE